MAQRIASVLLDSADSTGEAILSQAGFWGRCFALSSKSMPLRVLLIAALLLTTLSPSLSSQDKTTVDRLHLEQVKQQDDVDVAVQKGIAWLVSRQDPTHGYFQGKHKNAYTGLACIALMAAGHFPGRSEYGENLRRGLLYLASEARKKNGYLGDDGGRMYGHGICTLALTEGYGMLENYDDNWKLKMGIEPALRLIEKAQVKQRGHHYGGWRYEPESRDADLSVTAWQVLALRSAENCRLKVSEDAIKNALNYIRGTYNDKTPGFTYQRSGDSPAMRAAGVVCMLALGADEAKEDKDKIVASASFLKDYNPQQGHHYYYMMYYLATAANMMGGDYRSTVQPRLEKALIRLQKKDGQFDKYRGYDGGVYSTAVAIICLAVRYQYLPIYQE